MTSFFISFFFLGGGGGGAGLYLRGGGEGHLPPLVSFSPPLASVGCSTSQKLPPPLFCPYPKFAPPWKNFCIQPWGGIKQGHALQPTRGFGIDSSITLYQVAIGSSVMWPAFQPNLLIEVTCNFQVGCVAMVGTA